VVQLLFGRTTALGTSEVLELADLASGFEVHHERRATYTSGRTWLTIGLGPLGISLSRERPAKQV
jgi:hypothetical protein